MISKLIDEEVTRLGSIENINKNITHLDDIHSDDELVEIWNNLYDEYGNRFELFKDKWERENIGVIKDFGDKKDESKSLNPVKLDWVEKRKNKMKIIDLG